MLIATSRVVFLGRVNSGASGFNLGVKRKANDDEAKTKKAALASSKAKQSKQKTSVLEQIMQVGGILVCYYWSNVIKCLHNLYCLRIASRMSIQCWRSVFFLSHAKYISI